MDLLDSVDWSQVECLNALPDKPLANALKQVCRIECALVCSSPHTSSPCLASPVPNHPRGIGRTTACCWRATQTSSWCARLGWWVDGWARGWVGVSA